MSSRERRVAQVGEWWHVDYVHGGGRSSGIAVLRSDFHPRWWGQLDDGHRLDVPESYCVAVERVNPRTPEPMSLDEDQVRTLLAAEVSKMFKMAEGGRALTATDYGQQVIDQGQAIAEMCGRLRGLVVAILSDVRNGDGTPAQVELRIRQAGFPELAKAQTKREGELDG